jgi:hypothetical protein
VGRRTVRKDAVKKGAVKKRAADPVIGDAGIDVVARAMGQGLKARELAQELLHHCGFVDILADVRTGHGTEVSFSAVDGTGQKWHFDVSGVFTSTRAGLRRTDTLWKALGKAAVIHATHPDVPFVLVTTDAPVTGSPGDHALRALRANSGPGRFGVVFDVVEMESTEGRERLRSYAAKGPGAVRGHVVPGA